MNNLTEYFSARRTGYYLSCAAALLSLVVGILYGIGYRHSVYLNIWGVILPILGAVVFVVAGVLAMFFDKKDYIFKAGVIAMWLLDFIGFMVFVFASYLYLSEVFFAGFSLAALKKMNLCYIFCIVFYLAAIILANVGIYLRGGERTAAKEVNAQ